MSETTNSSMEVEENKNISFECVTTKNQEQVFSLNSSSSISGQFAKSNKNAKSDLRNSKFYMDVEKISNVEPEHDTDVQQTSENVTTVKYEPLEIESLVSYEGDRIDADSDENLPNGWINVTHASGIPLYLHKETKVCSFAKPYYIGNNSLKNHDVPLASIPCLNQKLKSQQMDSENNDGNLSEVPEVVTSKELHEYCKNLFKFKTIKFRIFNSWKKRREYYRKLKNNRKLKKISKKNVAGKVVLLPGQQSKETNEENEMLEKDKGDDNRENYITFKKTNKSYTNLLHEYARKKLRTYPSYELKVLENSRNPLMFTTILHGIRYGIGTGISRKQAKQDAARSTLDILIPSAENRIQIDSNYQLPERQGGKIQANTLFDELSIKDPRIPEFCNQVGELLPYDLLNICIKRNFGEHEEVKYSMEPLENVSDEENCYHCIISVQNHSTTFVCNNKREGRQKGAQALLQVLHPYVDNFGSILKLYNQWLNNESTYKERIEKPVTLICEKREWATKLRRPNEELLAKIRDAMSSPQTKLY